MTCWIGEVLDEPGMKSHTSMLGTFFVYNLALCMPIFKKKSPLKRLGKSYKLFIVVTLQFEFLLLLFKFVVNLPGHAIVLKIQTPSFTNDWSEIKYLSSVKMVDPVVE